MGADGHVHGGNTGGSGFKQGDGKSHILGFVPDPSIGGQNFNPGQNNGQGFNHGQNGGQNFNPGQNNGQGFNPGQNGGQNFNPGQNNDQGFNPPFLDFIPDPSI